MGKFVEFANANAVYKANPIEGDVVDKDGGITRNGVSIKDLIVYKDDTQLISCWELSPKEMLDVIRTGRVFLYVLGHEHPPVHISGINPWGEPIVDIMSEVVGDEVMLGDEPPPNAPPPVSGGGEGGQPPVAAT